MSTPFSKKPSSSPPTFSFSSHCGEVSKDDFPPLDLHKEGIYRVTELDEFTAVYRWRVDLEDPKFGNGEFLSPALDHFGYEWRIRFLYFGRSTQSVFSSLFLSVDLREDERNHPGWARYARFRLSLLHPQFPETLSITRTSKCRFCLNREDWGYRDFVHRKNYPAQGFIQKIKNKKYMYIQLILNQRREMQLVDPRKYCSRTETGYVGLKNQGCTCYLNSLLQTLFHITGFRKKLYEILVSNTKETSLPLALQKLFYSLERQKHAPSTLELTRSFGWTTAEAWLQHDIQELADILFDRLEKFKPDITDMFKGKCRDYIRCKNVNYQSSHEVDFSCVCLNVRGMKNLEESFRKYCEVDFLEGDNQYNTGKDNFGKQDAEKGLIFLDFPDVLMVCLKRFSYDLFTGEQMKVNDYFEFSREIDLSEFADRSSGGREGKSDEDYQFVLFSTTVHQGDLNAGHYWACISPNNDKWYRFDDEKVYEVSPEHSMTDNFGGRRRRTRQSNDQKFNFFAESNKDLFGEKNDPTDPKTLNKPNDILSPHGKRYLYKPGENKKKPYHDNFWNKSYIARHSNAYMLVYLKKSKINEILHPTTPNDMTHSAGNVLVHPEYLHKLFEDEFEMDMKAKAREAQIVDFRVFVEQDIRNKCIHHPSKGLFDIGKNYAQRTLTFVKKNTTLLEFRKSIEERFGVKVGDQERFWTVVERKNSTYRPHEVIVTRDMDPTKYLHELIPSLQPLKKDYVKIYVESVRKIIEFNESSYLFHHQAQKRQQQMIRMQNSIKNNNNNEVVRSYALPNQMIGPALHPQQQQQNNNNGTTPVDLNVNLGGNFLNQRPMTDMTSVRFLEENIQQQELYQQQQQTNINTPIGRRTEEEEEEKEIQKMVMKDFNCTILEPVPELLPTQIILFFKFFNPEVAVQKLKYVGSLICEDYQTLDYYCPQLYYLTQYASWREDELPPIFYEELTPQKIKIIGSRQDSTIKELGLKSGDIIVFQKYIAMPVRNDNPGLNDNNIINGSDYDDDDDDDGECMKDEDSFGEEEFKRMFVDSYYRRVDLNRKVYFYPHPFGKTRMEYLVGQKDEWTTPPKLVELVDDRFNSCQDIVDGFVKHKQAQNKELSTKKKNDYDDSRKMIQQSPLNNKMVDEDEEVEGEGDDEEDVNMKKENGNTLNMSNRMAWKPMNNMNRQPPPSLVIPNSNNKNILRPISSQMMMDDGQQQNLTLPQIGKVFERMIDEEGGAVDNPFSENNDNTNNNNNQGSSTPSFLCEQQNNQVNNINDRMDISKSTTTEESINQSNRGVNNHQQQHMPLKKRTTTRNRNVRFDLDDRYLPQNFEDSSKTIACRTKAGYTFPYLGEEENLMINSTYKEICQALVRKLGVPGLTWKHVRLYKYFEAGKGISSSLLSEYPVKFQDRSAGGVDDDDSFEITLKDFMGLWPNLDYCSIYYQIVSPEVSDAYRLQYEKPLIVSYYHQFVKFGFYTDAIRILVPPKTKNNVKNNRKKRRRIFKEREENIEDFKRRLLSEEMFEKYAKCVQDEEFRSKVLANKLFRDTAFWRLDFIANGRTTQYFDYSFDEKAISINSILRKVVKAFENSALLGYDSHILHTSGQHPICCRMTNLDYETLYFLMTHYNAEDQTEEQKILFEKLQSMYANEDFSWKSKVLIDVAHFDNSAGDRCFSDPFKLLIGKDQTMRDVKIKLKAILEYSHIQDHAHFEKWRFVPLMETTRFQLINDEDVLYKVLLDVKKTRRLRSLPALGIMHREVLNNNNNNNNNNNGAGSNLVINVVNSSSHNQGLNIK